MAYVLMTAAMLIWGYENNAFKKVLDDENYMKMTFLYYVLLGTVLTIIGAIAMDGPFIAVFQKGYLYLLFITELLSGIGIGIMFNRSNATLTIALTSASSMLSALLYAIGVKHMALIIVLIVVCISCLWIYFRESSHKLTLIEWILSILFIFLPSFIITVYMPTITDDFGNGTVVYGLSLLVPFLILSMFNLKGIIKQSNRKSVTGILSAVIAASFANYFCFLAFQLATSGMTSTLFFILSLEAVATEIVAYMIIKDQHRLDLGKKSKIQFVSILIFSLSCAATILAL